MFACSCWKIPNSEGAAGETSPSLEQDYFLKLYWLEKKKNPNMEQKMFIWCFGVWALPGSLHLFFPARSWHHKWEELTNKQQKAKILQPERRNIFHFSVLKWPLPSEGQKSEEGKSYFSALEGQVLKISGKHLRPGDGVRRVSQGFWCIYGVKKTNYGGNIRKDFKKLLISLTIWAQLLLPKVPLPWF